MMSHDEHGQKDLVRRKAVALRYDMDADGAPRMVAKGQGLVAEKIIEIAKANDVHVHENPDMVVVLSKLEINVEIPPELYQAVAEVLAFVYRLNKRLASD